MFTCSMAGATSLTSASVQVQSLLSVKNEVYRNLIYHNTDLIMIFCTVHDNDIVSGATRSGGGSVIGMEHTSWTCTSES